MAAMDKTVELEIRAQDYTGKTLGEVRKNVRGLKADLEEQAKAASKGKADFKRYEQGLKDLDNAAKKLSNLQQVANQLEKLGNDITAASDKADKSATAYRNLKNEIGKLGVPTKKQVEALEKLQNAHSRDLALVDKARNAYARQKIEAEALGLNTSNLSKTQQGLNKTYTRTLQTLIDMRQAQAALQKQNDRVKRIDYAVGEKALRAQRIEIARNEHALRRKLAAWQANKKAIIEARKEAEKAQRAREKAYRDQQAEIAKQAALNATQQQAAIAQRAAMNAQRQQIMGQRVGIQSHMANAQRGASPVSNLEGSISNTVNPTKSLDNAMRSIVSTTRKAQVALRNQKATLHDLKVTLKQTTAEQERMLAVARAIDAYKKQQVELARTKAQYATLSNEVRKLDAQMRLSGGGTQKQAIQLNQLVIKLNETGAALARQSVAASQAGANLQRMGVNLNNLAQAENRLAQNATRSQAAVGALNARINTLNKTLHRGSDEFQRYMNSSRTALGFMQRLKGQVIALTTAYFGLNGAIDLFNQVIQAGKDGAVMKIRTEVLADGWEGATASGLEEYFRGTAERMGLELKDVIQDASKLFVAAKENGYKVNEAQYVFEQFSGLGQLMGADAETQKGIIKALSDMFSKGAIQAEELKGQLGDRLPQALALFSQATGKSAAELMKMMEKGELTANYILDAAGVIDNKYGEAIKKMFDSIGANQARLKNSFQDWLRIIFDNGVGENFKQLLKDLTAWFRGGEAKQWAENIAIALNKVIDALRWCVQHINELAIAFGVLLTLGVGQMFGIFIISLSFMAKNFAIAGAAIKTAAVNLGILSTRAQAFFALMARNITSKNYFTALGLAARGLGVILASLFKRFIIFEIAWNIFKGLREGIEAVTGKSLTWADAMETVSDVFFVLGEVIKTVFEFVEMAMEGIKYLAFLTGKVIGEIINALGGMGSDFKVEWFSILSDSEGRFVGFGRLIMRVLDNMKIAFKSAFRYMGQWVQWLLGKVHGFEVEMLTLEKIVLDTTEEVKTDGSEARYMKRLEERKKAQESNATKKAEETARPEKRDFDNKAAMDKANAEREKAAERVEKARQAAEEARRKAEEAALKRLDKQLKLEELLKKRIAIWQGKAAEEWKQGQTFDEWYLGKYAAVRSQYAAPKDPYANITSDNIKAQNEAATKQYEAAKLQEQAAKTNTATAKANGTSSKPQGSNGTSKGVSEPQGSGSWSDEFSRKLAQNQRQWLGRELKGACAEGTRKGLEAAFGAKIGGQGHGNEVVRNMLSNGTAKRLGYVEITYDPKTYQPRVGDIQSLQRSGTVKGNRYGHVGVWGKDGLYSDGRQRTAINGTVAFRQDAYRGILNGTNRLRILRKVDANGNPLGELVRSNHGQALKGAVSAATLSKPLPVVDERAEKYYQAQKEQWEAMNVEGKQDERERQERENLDELKKEIAERNSEFGKTMARELGIPSLDHLAKLDPSKMRIDLASASLDAIVEGFANNEQPDINKKADEILQILMIDRYAKTGDRDKALEFGKQIEPQVKRYAELQVQQGMREQADKFIDALKTEREKWQSERETKINTVQSRVARGDLSADAAMREVADVNNEYVERMNTAITKLDALIGSEKFNQLDSSTQTAVKNSREELYADFKNPQKSTETTAANAMLDAHTAKMKQAVEDQINYEKMLDMQVASGMITLSQHQEKLQQYLTNNKQKMIELAEQAQKMMLAVGDKAGAENMAAFVTQLKDVQNATGRTVTQTKFLTEAQGKLQEGAMTAFQSMAQGVAGLLTGQMDYKEALAMTGQAMAQWAAETLMHLAKVIMQQIILNAVSRAFGSYGGSLGVTGGASAIGALFHTGGVVHSSGSNGWARRVNPALFANAPRYHSGGIVGLAPDEVPAILRRNEEVLTRQDPRHRANGGLSGNSGSPLTVINSFDPVEAQRQALASTKGRKVLVQAAGNERRAFGRL